MRIIIQDLASRVSEQVTERQPENWQSESDPDPLRGSRVDTMNVCGCSSGKPRSAKSATATADVASTSRFPPFSDVRLTVNLREDLHMRLKMEAVREQTTVGEILETLVDRTSKVDPLETIKRRYSLRRNTVLILEASHE